MTDSKKTQPTETRPPRDESNFFNRVQDAYITAGIKGRILLGQAISDEHKRRAAALVEPPKHECVICHRVHLPDNACEDLDTKAAASSPVVRPQPDTNCIHCGKHPFKLTSVEAAVAAARTEQPTPEPDIVERLERYTYLKPERLDFEFLELMRDAINAIKTEREMHNAWRKRAEESELAPAAPVAVVEPRRTRDEKLDEAEGYLRQVRDYADERLRWLQNSRTVPLKADSQRKEGAAQK